MQFIVHEYAVKSTKCNKFNRRTENFTYFDHYRLSSESVTNIIEKYFKYIVTWTTHHSVNTPPSRGVSPCRAE
jgi:hypothetical protein